MIPSLSPAGRSFLRVFYTLLLLGCTALFAEDPNGQVVQEKPGFALVKPQAWSQDNQASAVEFQAYTDRTVKGGVVAGYFIFRTAKNPNLQVPAALVVKLVVYPAPMHQIVRPEQRAELQKHIDAWKALIARFPLASRILDKPLAGLSEEAAKFDAGNVKDADIWVAKAAYYKKRADDLVNLAQVEINSAKKVRAMSLSLNQYYTGLEEMAKIEPSVQASVDGVRDLYEGLCRKEARIELCEKLKSPGVTFEDSVAYVKTLKTLHPEEDAAAGKAILLWDLSVAKAGNLNERIEAQRASFEQDLATKIDASKPVVLTGDLTARSRKIMDEFVGFPPTIQLPLPLAKAMATCAAGLEEIDEDMAARQYLKAKSKIAELQNPASLIGPRTLAALDLLSKKTRVEVDKFEARMADAKALATQGKAKEVLAKYQEAWEIIPDAELGTKIESLKK